MHSGRVSTAQVAPASWGTSPDVDDARGGGAQSASPGSAPWAERRFCEYLQHLGIDQVLDLGGAGSFAAALRRHGFEGVLYSAQCDPAGYRRLLAAAQSDPLWFPLARQGAGAAAFFTQRGAERVFINQSARLLHTQVMQGIQALRIDAQALAAGALEGYGPLIDRVRLILLDHTEAEAQTAAAGSGSQAFDTRRLEASGFLVVPPVDAAGVAAARIGAAAGHAAQVLWRPQAPALPEPVRGISIDAVITSVGGTLQRCAPDGTDLGPLWLQGCVQSWLRLGAPVISVAERAPPEGIAWSRTEVRPSIAQMIAAAPMTSGTHLLLTNADIVLTEALPALLGRLHAGAVYYGSRLDVERGVDARSGLEPRGVYELGFDYFLLPAPFVRAVLEDGLLPAELRVGEPWWDYLLPLLALARGFPLKKLGGSGILALHYLHPARYSTELWIRNRELFIQVASRLLAEADGHASGVLTELLAHPEQIPHLICRCLP